MLSLRRASLGDPMGNSIKDYLETAQEQALKSKQHLWERFSRGQELIILAGSAMLSFLVYGRGLLNSFVAEDFNMMALSTVDWARLYRFLIEATRTKPLPLLLNKAILPTIWAESR